MSRNTLRFALFFDCTDINEDLTKFIPEESKEYEQLGTKVAMKYLIKVSTRRSRARSTCRKMLTGDGGVVDGLS